MADDSLFSDSWFDDITSENIDPCNIYINYE